MDIFTTSAQPWGMDPNVQRKARRSDLPTIRRVARLMMAEQRIVARFLRCNGRRQQLAHSAAQPDVGHPTNVGFGDADRKILYIRHREKGGPQHHVTIGK
jgi:hypothetical protein